jgi:hypothetical protein
MATFNLFLGGDGTANGSYALPSALAAGAVVNGRTGQQSYADHQRARQYNVTRDLDFRDPAPFGGQGVSAGLNTWYKDNIASLVATDILRTHFLLPNTVLRFITLGVVVPVAGLQADVGLESSPFTQIPNHNFGVAGVTHYEFNPTSLVTAVDYVGIRFDAIPVGGFKDLVAWISVGVEDLYNGNAGA